MRARWGLRVALRVAILIALLMTAWTAYAEVGRYLQGRPVRPQTAFSAAAPSVFAYLNASPRWLMLAGLLLVADLAALRLLAPLPRGGCPRCGYDVDDSRQDRCPECGLKTARDTMRPAR